MPRLAALRNELDVFPSPVEDRPGLVLRDPYGYSDATLIIPPPLVQALALFDGQHDDSDLRQFLYQLTGEFDTNGIGGQLISALGEAGFLEDERFLELRDAAWRGFAESPVREAAHAREGGYPEDPAELRATLEGYLSDGGDAAPAAGANLIGLAAPHVSPYGGVASYRAAYRALGEEHRERTFVILGTSHYGPPDRLGLTRKDFATPLGVAMTDREIVDRLASEAGGGAVMEEYCHRFEHSIEFQVVFLQHVLKTPDIRIVPVLCGSYARSLLRGGAPEESVEVQRLLGALGELNAREGRRLCWVLGVDMAHMGRRYQDPFEALANQGVMERVRQEDSERIGRMREGDAGGFWDLVQKDADPLKWCGSAPIYTFLRAVPEARGRLERYEQWNIDEESVVTFAGMRFEGRG